MAKRAASVSRGTKSRAKGAKAVTRAPSAGKIRDRVVGLQRVRAGDLALHPGNPRRHPQAQVSAVSALQREIGYADALLAYRDGGKLALFDGHLRRSLDDDQIVPVLETDLSPAEAALMLAAGDHTGSLADVDPHAMATLAGELEPTDAEAAALLADIGAEAEMMSSLEGDLNTEPKPGRTMSGAKAGAREKWEASVLRVVIAVPELTRIEVALDVAGGATRGESLVRICREWMEANEETQLDG